MATYDVAGCCEGNISSCSEMLGCDGSGVIFLSVLCLKRDRINGFCCLGFQIHHASLMSSFFYIVRRGCLTWLAWILITGIMGQGCFIPRVHIF